MLMQWQRIIYPGADAVQFEKSPQLITLAGLNHVLVINALTLYERQWRRHRQIAKAMGVFRSDLAAPLIVLVEGRQFKPQYHRLQFIEPAIPTVELRIIVFGLPRGSVPA